MLLTRSFKQTIHERLQREPAFAKSLLTEAINAWQEGDAATGKAILRDLIRATRGPIGRTQQKPPSGSSST